MGDKKRYRLLKDYSRPTHVIRSGTEGGDNHWKNVFPELLGIDLLTLPDWFQLIEEKPEQKEETTEEFKWDEALIEEFIMTENCGYSIQLLRKQIATFKKSRSSKTKGMVEVTKIETDGFSDHGNWYRFHVAGNKDRYMFDIPKEMIPAIKEAIEKVLNNEPQEAFVNLNVKHGSKSFTEEDMWRAREDAFLAARSRSTKRPTIRIVDMDNSAISVPVLPAYTYLTFQDYLNSLNQPSKP